MRGPTSRPASPRPARSATSRSRWPSGRSTRPSSRKQIDNLDFPKIAREQYGIEGVEFVNQFFKDKAHDSAYLKDLKSRADDVGVTCVLIMIDGEGDLERPGPGQAGQGRREPQEVGRRRRRARLPRDPGQHGRALQPDRRRRRGRGLLQADRVRREEPHQDHLREPRRAVEQPRRPDRPDEGREQADLRHPARLRQLPPQGRNGKYTIDVYDAIARMMPYAKGVSAKSYDFDDSGRETMLDFARIMKIVTDAGYHGFVGIEYEGGRLSEPEGIKATKKLLESLRGSTYQPGA